jgi:prolyl-tRNA synthetase
LVCPPRLAPTQVIIVPIWRNDEQKSVVTTAGKQIRTRLDDVGVRVDIDLRDGMKPGAKYFEWEARGVPLRLEVGPRDVEGEQTVVARRTGGKEPVKLANLEEAVQTALVEIQGSLFTAACDRREARSVRGITKAGLLDLMAGDGGFAYGGYCGDHECEVAIQQETKATVRVLPDEESRSGQAPETCVWCGKPSIAEAVWAKAY